MIQVEDPGQVKLPEKLPLTPLLYVESFDVAGNPARSV